MQLLETHCFRVVITTAIEPYLEIAMEKVWGKGGFDVIQIENAQQSFKQVTFDEFGVSRPVLCYVFGKADPKYGRYATDHGALVPHTGVSVAIGDCSLEFHTGTFAFEQGDSLVLCSDGIHQSSSFTKDIIERLNALVLSEAIQTMGTTSVDDATLLVLRREVVTKEMPGIELMMSDFETYRSKWPLNAIIERFASEIMRLLESGAETDRLASMVRFAKENELCPGKAEIKEIFEAAVAASGKHPEEAEQYRQICGDLKEMLQYAHRQVSLA